MFLVEPDSYLEDDFGMIFFIEMNNNVLLVVVPGSIFGFAVTSCDDDFLGIRNNPATDDEDANGLFAAAAAAADGLVNFDASIGGDVTCCLLVFAPVGIERARCFNASRSEFCALFDACDGCTTAAVVPVAVAVGADVD